MSGRAVAAVGLLLTGLGCQALVDVSQYRFDRDGGVDTAEPQPPPGADDVAEPVAAQDAGNGGAVSAPVSEAPSLPPLLPPDPAVDAGAGTELSGAEEEPPPSDEPEPPPEDPASEDAGLTPVEPEPAPEPPPADPPEDPRNGCSLVEFCLAYQVVDTVDEERCRQRGCSVEAAIAECRVEVLDACGAVQPPFAFYTLDGERLELQ